MEIIAAIIGALVALGVQGVVVVGRQHARRVAAGQIAASRRFIVVRKVGLRPRRRGLRRLLASAAVAQRDAIEDSHRQDRFWKLGQVKLGRASVSEIAAGSVYTLRDAMLSAEGARGVFVRGASGAGKSTLAASTAAYWPDPGCAIRVDLAGFDDAIPLLEQVGSDLLRTKDLERGLALDLVVLIFDGYESLRSEAARQKFDHELTVMRRRFPGVRLAVLSRPDVQPTRSLLRSSTYDLMPLAMDDIRAAVKSVGLDEGIVDHLDSGVRQLCTSPLALRMLIGAYEQYSHLPQSRTSLYRDFVAALLAEKDGAESNAISPEAKLEIAAALAASAGNQTVAIDKGAAIQALVPKVTELASAYSISSSVDAAGALRTLVDDGIVRVEKRSFRFIHYSVQEYLCAVHLQAHVIQRAGGLEKVLDIAASPQWRNTVVFLSGLLADATELVAQLRFRNRTLAAECIESARVIDSALVDRCIVEALYEFKFGKTSFNYELVFALAVIARRRSSDLPERISTELEFWCAKYATVPLKELSEVDDEALLSLVADGHGAPQVCDAIWTLGLRKSERARPLLEEFVVKRTAPFHHVAALALGRLGSSRSARLLLDTAMDTSATDTLRSACFNSVGLIGAKDCLPVLVSFIRSRDELNGTVRENAMWALVGGVTDDVVTGSRDFQELIIDQLNVGTPYARAMAAYLIGRFRIQEGISALEAMALNPETDPLVLEDVVFALAELDSVDSVEVLKELLSHGDSIVRARTIEATARLGISPTDLSDFASDSEPSDIVRDAANLAVGRILERSRGVSEAERPADIRRRR